mgnify:CR=1 FL=1
MKMTAGGKFNGNKLLSRGNFKATISQIQKPGPNDKLKYKFTDKQMWKIRGITKGTFVQSVLDNGKDSGFVCDKDCGSTAA